MTSVKFIVEENRLLGFEINGHCSVDGDDEVGKIVCSAVSSAAYMTANTITEIIGDKADISVDEAKMFFKTINPGADTVKVLMGLKLHLTELSNQYSNNIKIYGGAKTC